MFYICFTKMAEDRMKHWYRVAFVWRYIFLRVNFLRDMRYWELSTTLGWPITLAGGGKGPRVVQTLWKVWLSQARHSRPSRYPILSTSSNHSENGTALASPVMIRFTPNQSRSYYMTGEAQEHYLKWHSILTKQIKLFHEPKKHLTCSPI